MKNHGGLSIPVSKEGDRENNFLILTLEKQTPVAVPWTTADLERPKPQADATNCRQILSLPSG